MNENLIILAAVAIYLVVLLIARKRLCEKYRQCKKEELLQDA